MHHNDKFIYPDRISKWLTFFQVFMYPYSDLMRLERISKWSEIPPSMSHRQKSKSSELRQLFIDLESGTQIKIHFGSADKICFKITILICDIFPPGNTLPRSRVSRSHNARLPIHNSSKNFRRTRHRKHNGHQHNESNV